ncbi:helix-turn-helix domain-containing protein [Agromyces sp. CFH 90414]|uniref:Helix-turn-helix domain-containing protein n=1 Tax=Agromyces agglutinans TaxID=2662258 RepID=A0A6I2F537_9MICO|nr:AraC family transcriptional regulator [Agromyces agglutinans]MRG59752.1 helix-turn-helix domain-containing protein [Agromyces agglutinans]
MCTITPPRGIRPADDASVISRLIAVLRWSMVDFTSRELRAGELRRDEHDATRFHMVVDGTVELHRADEVVTLRRGDVALLPHGGTTRLAARRDARVLSATIALLGPHPTMIRAMPPLLAAYGFVEREPGFASLLDTMHREASEARPGADTVIAGLTDVVISAAVRFWLEHGCGTARTWLAAASDPNVGEVLAAIHENPGSPWTVESLARIARASRSQFAEQFRAAVGDTPARYVTRIRMAQAERMLRDGEPVGGIAHRLGYDSEEGFSRAFRRHSGVAPSRWRRAALQPVA